MIRSEPILALLSELNGTDECEDLEAKHVSGTDVGKSTYETICALSNEPSLKGGTILLGVQREQALFPIYKASGVRDPDQLSADIASACASIFNQTIRVDIRPFKVGDATVLKIDVPELPQNQKPLKALIFVREVGAIDNSAYRSLTQTDTLTASKCLRQPRELNLLEDHGSGARTHYVAGPQLVARGGRTVKALKTGDNMDGRRASMDAKLGITDLPVPLRLAVRSAQLKERADPEEMQKLILRLCDWRPLALSELSRFLFRSASYIQQKFVTPLIADGKLVYLFPEMTKHPGQKYQTPRLARLGIVER